MDGRSETHFMPSKAGNGVVEVAHETNVYVRELDKFFQVKLVITIGNTHCTTRAPT